MLFKHPQLLESATDLHGLMFRSTTAPANFLIKFPLHLIRPEFQFLMFELLKINCLH